MRGSSKAGTAKLGLLLCVAAAMLAVPSAASADQVICAAGHGAGQCEKPRGVAVDTSSGRVYATDYENNRIDVFEESGAFLFAFGWGVNATTPEEKLQTCTTATGCQKGTRGPGAGQFGEFNRGGIAVDPSSHAVYVSEDNHRLQKFDSEGHFVWMAGGEVDKVTHANLCTVAANCDAGKAAEKEAGKEEGRFFGTSGGGLPVAVGPAGVVYVADSRKLGTAESEGEGFNTRVQRFEPSGASAGSQLLLPGTRGHVNTLAVDSAGSFYVTTENEGGAAKGTNAVYKYEAGGSLASGWGESGKVDPGHSVLALALAPAGDLFVSEVLAGGKSEILRFDPAGAESLVFFGAGTLVFWPVALAFHHTAAGDLYAAERYFGGGIGEPARLVQIALPEPGPLLVPGSTEASPIGNVRATLKVTFNPEGKASTAHFQYITKAAYEADGNSFGAGTQTTPDSAPTPAGFVNQTASATNTCLVPTEPTCLKPETTYYFRPIAANIDGEVTGERAEFTTLPPLQILATWATEVGTDGTRLYAEVNPLTIHATAHFEYVDDATFQADLPNGFQHAKTTAAALDFGSGEKALARATQATGLEAGTVYHYRLIAEDTYFPPVAAAEGIFTTFALPAAGAEACPANEAFRTGPSAALADCRAYEMVTPLDKSNGDVLTRINGTGYPTSLDQSSAEGSGFTYSSYRAFANPQSAPYTDQLLAARHERGQVEEGWSNAALDPPRGPQFRSGEFENEYKAFSADLSSAWLLQEGEPTLDSCAPAGFADLYRRAGAGGAYQALSCAHPSLQFEALAAPNPPSQLYMPELQGASADGTHAVFRIDDALTPGASGAGKYQVYESTGAGVLHLVSVLPNGEASEANSSAGTGSKEVLGLANSNRFSSLLHAVSDSGARVFWSTGFSGSGPLYLRTNADQPQSALAHGSATGTGRLTEGSTAVISLVAAKGKASLTTGSPTATLLETSVGKFVAGQPVSGAGIQAGTTILSVSGNTLTLSKAATATSASATLTSTGPQPFAAGQTITAPGIPLGTTIVEAKAGELKLSAASTVTQSNVPLEAVSECTEAAKACTIAVSGTITPEGAFFQTANPQGTEALFTVRAGPLAGNLYRFDSAAEPPASQLIAAKTLTGSNILGASEDLSRVYFASEEASAPQQAEGAVKGKPNVYLYDEGTTRFIATLSSGLAGDLSNPYGQPTSTAPIERTARVSPDGQSLVFMSNSRELSEQSAEYDNTDQESGEADAEVYLYDAAANAGSGKLRCLSCNPSGARPLGRELEGYSGNNKGTDGWAAAAVPRATTQSYQPRYLSGDGRRVFFDSFDPLVLGDTNGKQDAYQWEEAGVGGCKTVSPSYAPASEGCLSLLSSGQSPDDSEFLDASSSGSDAFFTTAEGLLPQDYGLIDVYDARIDGGFPPPPGRPIICEGEACQSPPEAPNDPTPASSAFEGAGNVREEPLARCAKGKTRRKGRCVATKHKRAKRHHTRHANRNGRPAR